MADGTVRDFTLSWGTRGYDEVRGEAARVDEALVEVSARVDDVARRTEAGRQPLNAYGTELDKLSKRAEGLARGIKQATTSTESAEDKAVRAAQRDAARRIQLLEDETARRLQLLDARHARELRAAERAGDDVALVQAVHAQQRQDLDAKIAERAELEAQRETRARQRAAREAMAADLATMEARARAIADGSQRELALLDVKHRKELAAAERAGRDLTSLAEAQAAERARVVEKIRSSAKGGGAAADDLGDGLKKAGEEANKASGGLEAFEKGVGMATKLLSGFGLLSIPAAISGAIDLGKQFWLLTDAGKAQAAASEAQKTAIDSLVGSLREVSDLTRISTEDLAGYVLAQRQMTLTEGKLNEAIDERVELEAERREAVEAAAKAERSAAQALELVAKLGTGVYAGLRDSAQDAREEVEEINRRIAESDRALNNHAKAHRDAQAALRETRRDVQALGDPLELLTEQWKKASEAAAREADKIKREAEEAARKLRESLLRQLDLSDAIDLDALPSVDWARMLGPGDFDPTQMADVLGPVQTAFADALGDMVGASFDAVMSDSGGAWLALAQAAETVGGHVAATLGAFAPLLDGEVPSALDQIGEAFVANAEKIAAAGTAVQQFVGELSSGLGVASQMASLESSNAIQRARNRERDAKGEKARAEAAKAVLQAERAAEAERRKFQAADFALRAAENAGAAITEAGKAAGSYPDPVGMALHGFAAIKHAAAAVFYGRGAVSSLQAPSAVGGGAAAASVGATPRAPSRADSTAASGGGGTSITYITVNSPADQRSTRTAIVDAYNTVGDGMPQFQEAA